MLDNSGNIPSLEVDILVMLAIEEKSVSEHVTVGYSVRWKCNHSQITLVGEETAAASTKEIRFDLVAPKIFQRTEVEVEMSIEVMHLD